MPSYTADALERRNRLPWLHPRDGRFERLVDKAVLALFGLTKPPRRCQRNEIARRLKYRVALYELSTHPIKPPVRHFDDVRREDVAEASAVLRQNIAFVHAMQSAGYRG